MQGLPPLRYLRKTTIVFLAVFLCFVIHRIFVSVGPSSRNREVPSAESVELSSVVCRNIVGGAPFGIDTVFPPHIRLYYYAAIPHLAWDVPDRKVLHIWYNGADTAQKVLCRMADSTCESSIAPQMLVPGEWSVDAVDGHKLLSSRQFRIEAARN